MKTMFLFKRFRVHKRHHISPLILFPAPPCSPLCSLLRTLFTLLTAALLRSPLLFPALPYPSLLTLFTTALPRFPLLSTLTPALSCSNSHPCPIPFPLALSPTKNNCKVFIWLYRTLVKALSSSLCNVQLLKSAENLLTPSFTNKF